MLTILICTWFKYMTSSSFRYGYNNGRSLNRGQPYPYAKKRIIEYFVNTIYVILLNDITVL